MGPVEARASPEEVPQRKCCNSTSYRLASASTGPTQPQALLQPPSIAAAACSVQGILLAVLQGGVTPGQQGQDVV